MLCFTALYGAAACLFWLFPANASWREPSAGIDVFLLSNEAHVDLVLPVSLASTNWRRILTHPDIDDQVVDSTDYLAIGWGEREFYLNTPTWSEVNVTRALKSLFWSSATVLHVVFLREVPKAGRVQRFRVTPEQLDALRSYVADTFRVDSNQASVPVLRGGYSSRDAFYEANGQYHLFNTCNNWTARALRHAGIRAPLWAPFAFAVTVSSE